MMSDAVMGHRLRDPEQLVAGEEMAKALYAVV
jgi:hypothetical protein